MELSHLQAFIAVARAGGFAAAAQAQGLAPSSVTRAVAKLEARLDARLFQRTNRRVALTDAGAALLARLEPALEEIEAALDEASAGEKAPAGLLRITASTAYGQLVIAPRLGAFRTQFPDIDIELLLSDATADLISERIDIAFRHGALADSGFIAQRFQNVEYQLVASPGFLASAPRIRTPDDISRCPCLSFTYPAFADGWRFMRDGEIIDVAITPALKVTNALTLADCARRDMGLAILPDWALSEDLGTGRLKRVLPSWRIGGLRDENAAAISIVTPSRAFTPAKTRAFIDFMRRR